MADDLSRLEEWLGRVAQGFSPAQRQRAALRMMQALRRSNLARIAANTQPDGSPMAPRKPRKARDGRQIRQGKMFRGLRYAKNWRIRSDAEGGELFPATNAAARTAAVHHFGDADVVGKTRDGRTIRYRYPARHLLGFGPEDEQIALEIAAELFDLKR